MVYVMIFKRAFDKMKLIVLLKKNKKKKQNKTETMENMKKSSLNDALLKNKIVIRI